MTTMPASLLTGRNYNSTSQDKALPSEQSASKDNGMPRSLKTGLALLAVFSFALTAAVTKTIVMPDSEDMMRRAAVSEQYVAASSNVKLFNLPK